MTPEEELPKLAMLLLSRKAYTKKGLSDRLSSKIETTPEIIEMVVNKMVELGFINDRLYADDFVRAKLELNHWGARKIRLAMGKKGFDKETISDSFERLESGKEIQAALSALSKMKELKLNEFSHRQKAIQRLAGRGFGYGTIISALESYAIKETQPDS